jgi:hypothetical protein
LAKLTFRSQALEKLTSPEQLDLLIQVVPLKSWLALFGIACLLAPLLGWGLWGRLETRIAANGLLLPQGGLCAVRAPADGLVVGFSAQPGELVQTGQVIFRLQPAYTEQPQAVAAQAVASQCSGKVFSLAVQAGDPVRQGDTLLMLEPAGKPLEAIAYLPLRSARTVQPGMQVRISPAGLQPEVYGYLMGTVQSVGQYPAPIEQIIREVGGESIAQTFAQPGGVVQVHVALRGTGGEGTGDTWSLKRAASPVLFSGTPCSLFIVVDRRAPIWLIFPGLRQSTAE